MIAILVPPGSASAGATIELDDDEAHHLRVRRADADVEVQVRDGQGMAGVGRLRLDGKRARVSVERVTTVPRPAAVRLAVGAGERDRFAWLVEKATELGVSDIFPLETAHAATVGSRLRDPQLDRLRRRALETLKQCGAAWAPVVHPPTSLAALLERDLAGEHWLADPTGQEGAGAFSGGPLTAIIGPEGGLTGAERAAALSAGYRPLRLGEHILRFETAALAVAAGAAAARLGGRHG